MRSAPGSSPAGAGAKPLLAFLLGLLLLALPALFASCIVGGVGSGGGGGAADADDPVDTPAVSSNSTITAQTPLAPGGSCPAGGYQIDYGIDDNSDGVLDAAEIDETVVICNGDDGRAGGPGRPGGSGSGGTDSLAATTPEPAGSNCINGGSRLDVGLDNGDGGGAAGDGVLQPGEIDGTTYVCADSAGTNEGSPAAPVALTVETPHLGSVAANGASYYSFTTEAGTAKNYLVTLGGTASDLSWRLFSDAGFAGEIASCDRSAVHGSEYCFTPLLAVSTAYYLEVREKDVIAGTFTLRVTPPFLMSGNGGLAIRPGDGSTFPWPTSATDQFSSMAFDPVTMSLYGGTGYGYMSGCKGCIFSVNLATGGQVYITQPGYSLPGMAIRPSDGLLFAFETYSYKLVSIDAAAGTFTIIGSSRGALGSGMIFDGSEALYLFQGTTLYLIEAATALSTNLGGIIETGFPDFSDNITDLAISPIDGTVYFSMRNGDFGTVDLCTLEAVYISTPVGYYLNGLAWIGPGKPPYPKLCAATGSAGQAGTVTLTWRDYPVADSYNIHYGTASGALPNVISAPAGVQYIHTIAAGSYFYRIVPVVGGVEVGPGSDEVSGSSL